MGVFVTSGQQGGPKTAAGRLGYWRTLPIFGSSGMVQKTLAACETAGSVSPIPCRRFLDPNRRVERDVRRDYGEERFRLYGRAAGRLFVIAYTRRGMVTRIISARKANARERERYGAD